MTQSVKFIEYDVWRCAMTLDDKNIYPICFENDIARHKNGSGQTYAPTHGDFHTRMDWIDANLSMPALERYWHLYRNAKTREEYITASQLWSAAEKEDKKNAKLLKQQFPEIRQYIHAYSCLSRMVVRWRRHQAKGFEYDYHNVFDKAKVVEKSVWAEYFD
jgi:hypothetical protein